MSKDLSADWLEDEEVIEGEEEVFEGGSSSPFIQGYGAYDVKITMAKRIVVPKKKVEFIELDFISQDGKTHTESFMVRGKDGKPFYIGRQTHNKGKKVQHMGVDRIKSLLKVANVYPDSENLMKDLYSNTEQSDVTYTKFGKEKTEEFTVFKDLLGVKVKICLASKKENAQTAADGDDSKYIKQCIADTEAFKKANPKKKSLQKFKADDDYVNVYKWFVNSEVKHFCSIDGLFASELGKDEGVLLDRFVNANEEGIVFDMRTLICDDMSDTQLARLGINQYGKRVEEETDDGYEEPTEEDEDDTDEW